MPRIRTLKPEFATDEKLAKVSRDARLTFVLCITQADDDGLLPGNHRQLLAALYPLDDAVTYAKLAAWIEELVELGRFRWRETVDGSPILEIVNWGSHQKVDHKGKSLILPHLKPFAERSASDSRDIREDGATASRSDLGPGTKDHGPTTKDHGPAVHTGLAADALFAKVWAKYPRRSGGNPRTEALAAWRTRLAAGVEPSEMEAGLDRYAAYVRAKGKEGTEFVMQGKRFFGPSEQWLEPWLIDQVVGTVGAAGGDDTAWAGALDVAARMARREIDAESYREIPEPIRKGLSAIGGWTTIRDARQSDLQFRRKDFLTAYHAAERQMAGAA